MIDFINDNRADFGVEPICKVLPIAPSTAFHNLAVMRTPELASNRAKQDLKDRHKIDRVFAESGHRYGSRKVWHQLSQEGFEIGKCRVERLMKEQGLQGVVRGKKVITTNPDTAQPCPLDKVDRQFKASAPNRLWVSDFTYVSSWELCPKVGDAWKWRHIIAVFTDAAFQPRKWICQPIPKIM